MGEMAVISVVTVPTRSRATYQRGGVCGSEDAWDIGRIWALRGGTPGLHRGVMRARYNYGTVLRGRQTERGNVCVRGWGWGWGGVEGEEGRSRRKAKKEGQEGGSRRRVKKEGQEESLSRGGGRERGHC